MERLSEALAEINRNGLTILLVEQDVATAFEIAEAAFVIETGRTTRSGKTTELSTDPKVPEAIFRHLNEKAGAAARFTPASRKMTREDAGRI